eukprot:2755249-Alexandrium_andersonii.AAC.1
MLGMILRGACPCFQPQLPPRAEGRPGDAVDIYTDGSVDCANDPFLAHGGSGLWVSQRVVDCQPLDSQ